MAISMKKFMPMPKKKESLGAKSSMERPPSMAARIYCFPSASVKAVCSTELAPASMMW